MTKFEYEHRSKLELAVCSTRDRHDRLMQKEGFESMALEAQQDYLAAEAELVEWDSHLVQLVPAPLGLVAVYANENGIGEHRGAIIMCGLQRNGTMTALSFDPEGAFLPAETVGNFVRLEFETETGLHQR